MAVKIIKCDCKAEPSHGADYQNKKYGAGMRVCNEDQQKKSAQCTVCGKIHNIK